MDLHLEWAQPIDLIDGSEQGLIYTREYYELPDRPGIYVFGRRHGQREEALYVGKIGIICDRVRKQLDNVQLMKHLENAKTGTRFVQAGCFVAKSGQKLDKALRLIERSLIWYFLFRADDLANIHGTLLKQHEITSSGGRNLVPRMLYVEH